MPLLLASTFIQARKHLYLKLMMFFQILKEVLPEGMTIPTAFESVGHIAHLNLRNEYAPYRHTIAQVRTAFFVTELFANSPLLLDYSFLTLNSH
jgi:tRNA G37 N-methylase Trm5